MTGARGALQLPYDRVLLARTRLAYVHLQNLLTDAKRDRAARVFGYVAVWLPDELLVLYLQEGEVVAATASRDSVQFRELAIREAVRRVPHAAEYGHVCFHTADDELLACMHAAQTLPPDPFPPEVRVQDASAVLAHLMAGTYDGVVELRTRGRVSYLIVRRGAAARVHMQGGTRTDELDATVRGLWPAGEGDGAVRRWPVPRPLPNQAPPALIDAYRALMRGLAQHLESVGVSGAVQVVERARLNTAEAHRALEGMPIHIPNPRDPVTTAPELTRGVAAWMKDVLLSVALPEGASADEVVQRVTRDRRHLLQSAGFFDALPWKPQ